MTSDTTISASRSYDPDTPGAQLGFSWTSWPDNIISPAVSTSSIIIDKSKYKDETTFTSFTVFLVVSYGIKSSKTYMTVKFDSSYLDSPKLVSTTPKIIIIISLCK